MYISVAVDSSDSVFIPDSGLKELLKLAPDGTRTILATGLVDPRQVATDAAGNVYFTDAGASTITKIPPTGSGSVLVRRLNNPSGLAIDSGIGHRDRLWGTGSAVGGREVERGRGGGFRQLDQAGVGAVSDVDVSCAVNRHGEWAR